MIYIEDQNPNKESKLWTDEKPAVLHIFAKKMGLSRSWFQNKIGPPHYKIIPMKRDQAIKNGAIPMNLKDWLQRLNP